jgi:hypothetical protein
MQQANENELITRRVTDSDFPNPVPRSLDHILSNMEIVETRPNSSSEPKSFVEVQKQCVKDVNEVKQVEKKSVTVSEVREIAACGKSLMSVETLESIRIFKKVMESKQVPIKDITECWGKIDTIIAYKRLLPEEQKKLRDMAEAPQLTVARLANIFLPGDNLMADLAGKPVLNTRCIRMGQKNIDVFTSLVLGVTKGSYYTTAPNGKFKPVENTGVLADIGKKVEMQPSLFTLPFCEPSVDKMLPSSGLLAIKSKCSLNLVKNDAPSFITCPYVVYSYSIINRVQCPEFQSLARNIKNYNIANPFIDYGDMYSYELATMKTQLESMLKPMGKYQDMLWTTDLDANIVQETLGLKPENRQVWQDDTRHPVPFVISKFGKVGTQITVTAGMLVEAANAKFVHGLYGIWGAGQTRVGCNVVTKTADPIRTAFISAWNKGVLQIMDEVKDKTHLMVAKKVANETLKKKMEAMHLAAKLRSPTRYNWMSDYACAEEAVMVEEPNSCETQVNFSYVPFGVVAPTLNELRRMFVQCAYERGHCVEPLGPWEVASSLEHGQMFYNGGYGSHGALHYGVACFCGAEASGQPCEDVAARATVSVDWKKAYENVAAFSNVISEECDLPLYVWSSDGGMGSYDDAEYACNMQEVDALLNEWYAGLQQVGEGYGVCLKDGRFKSIEMDSIN